MRKSTDLRVKNPVWKIVLDGPRETFSWTGGGTLREGIPVDLPLPEATLISDGDVWRVTPDVDPTAKWRVTRVTRKKKRR